MRERATPQLHRHPSRSSAALLAPAALLLKYLVGGTGSAPSPAQVALCPRLSLWAGHAFFAHVSPFILGRCLVLLWLTQAE